MNWYRIVNVSKDRGYFLAADTAALAHVAHKALADVVPTIPEPEPFSSWKYEQFICHHTGATNDFLAMACLLEAVKEPAGELPLENPAPALKVAIISILKATIGFVRADDMVLVMNPEDEQRLQGRSSIERELRLRWKCTPAECPRGTAFLVSRPGADDCRDEKEGSPGPDSLASVEIAQDKEGRRAACLTNGAGTIRFKVV